jgi:hypothetical protein
MRECQLELIERKGEAMDPTIMFAGLFVMGLLGLGLCFAFIIACEKIYGGAYDLLNSRPRGRDLCISTRGHDTARVVLAINYQIR